MPNILDYLDWRGDLTLAQTPFCDVDALVLSRFSYLPLDGVVPERFSDGSMRLSEAAARLLTLLHDPADGRTVRLRDDEPLLRRMGESARFGAARLTGFVNRFDPEEEKQFSAVTLLLPDDTVFIAYRGTDGTLVGWKEDFNMSFSDAVPAQRDAAAYLAEAASAFPGGIRLGGHSKGGNLAVYAAAFGGQAVQDRILSVCNNDGPGFTEETAAKGDFTRVIGRVRTYLPQSSVVGMLLEHEEHYTVVHSTNVGILQHDPYSWEVLGAGFVTVESVTGSSQFIDRTLKDWVKTMPPEKREKMIDGVFAILGASDARTFREILTGKNAAAVWKAYGNLDEDTKKLLLEALTILKNSAKKSLPAGLERWIDPAK